MLTRCSMILLCSIISVTTSSGLYDPSQPASLIVSRKYGNMNYGGQELEYQVTILDCPYLVSDKKIQTTCSSAGGKGNTLYCHLGPISPVLLPLIAHYCPSCWEMSRHVDQISLIPVNAFDLSKTFWYLIFWNKQSNQRFWLFVLTNQGWAFKKSPPQMVQNVCIWFQISLWRQKLIIFSLGGDCSVLWEVVLMFGRWTLHQTISRHWLMGEIISPPSQPLSS